MAGYIVPEEQVESYFLERQENAQSNSNSMDCILGAKFVSYDMANMSMVVEYDAKEWAINGGGVLHGGIICTMIDHSLGCLIRAFTGAWTPTIEIDTAFLNPAGGGQTLVCKASITKLGKQIVFAEGVLFEKTKGFVVAKAQGSYVNMQKKKY